MATNSTTVTETHSDAALTAVPSQLSADTRDSAPAFEGSAVNPPSGTAVIRDCIHCGQSTPSAVDTPDVEVFCCSGCRTAYHLIQGWGLGEFYALRDQVSATAQAAVSSGLKRFEQFDQSDFLGPSTPVVQANGLCTAELAVQNLHCAACAWLIESVAAETPGWHAARVKMSDHTLRVAFDPEKVKLSGIAALLSRLGYDLTPLDRSAEKHIEEEHRRLLIQIAIAGFLAANAMWIAVALYAGEAAWLAEEHRYFLGLVGTVLGGVSVFGPGRTFLRGAWASITTRKPHMDLPIAMGLTIGAVAGLINGLRGFGDIYFDSIAALVFFLLIGRWFQFRQQQRAASAVDLLMRITPRYATRIADSGVHETVLADSLRPGQRIHVAVGESLAADGILDSIETVLDRSLLTGESQPVTVRRGEPVAAGTINLSAPVTLTVTATGTETRMGRVMQSVELAAAERTPIVQLADRVGMAFVVGITLLAILAMVLWLPTGFARAASIATALLIVACPCGLALATPLAIAVGLGRAAKRKILIRDGQSLQKLSDPGQMWLDKTGTLTEGRQRVTTVVGDLQGVAMAAAIEHECMHPVACAIVKETELRSLPTMKGSLDRVILGGAIGRVGEHSLLVGNTQFIEQQGLLLGCDWREHLQAALERGESPIWIAVDGQLTTLLGLSDPLRSDAQSVLQHLRAMGWKVGVLSGDHPAVVARVARQLGLDSRDCFGGLSPEEKLAAIRESRRHERTVVMVGDGANDAAALAAADVGIAIRGGAEVSLQAAPVFVASGNLQSILGLVRGATATTRTIYATFAVSLAYNVLAVGICMGGFVSPLVAAMIMPASSASVLAIVVATRTFDREKS